MMAAVARCCWIPSFGGKAKTRSIWKVDWRERMSRGAGPTRRRRALPVQALMAGARDFGDEGAYETSSCHPRLRAPDRSFPPTHPALDVVPCSASGCWMAGLLRSLPHRPSCFSSFWRASSGSSWFRRSGEGAPPGPDGQTLAAHSMQRIAAGRAASRAVAMASPQPAQMP